MRQIRMNLNDQSREFKKKNNKEDKETGLLEAP